MWKWFLHRPSQSSPFMNIHNPYWIIKWADILLSLSFPRSLNHSGFCKVKFHFLDTNFCFKPLIYNICYTERNVAVRQAKVFISRKLVPPAMVTLPPKVIETTRPPKLSEFPPPQHVCVSFTNVERGLRHTMLSNNFLVDTSKGWVISLHQV